MKTLFKVLVLLLLARPAVAGDLQGKISDKTGGVLKTATVQLVDVTTGMDIPVTVDANGQYRVPDLRPGVYWIAVTCAGFSAASRTIVIEDPKATTTEDFVLELGGLKTDVNVTAERGQRDAGVLPIRTDTLTKETIEAMSPVSTGDAMIAAPGVTPVGSGPFQVRPRLRGLDSTRVLVLVDGERLNNARTATDRAGVEVDLVDLDSAESIEVLGGAGSVLYGTDALSGTINIITNQPVLSSKKQFSAGFDGLYSSNENGRRGTVLFGYSSPKFAVGFTGGGERFDDYTAGKHYQESSQPYFTNGTIKQADTIDDNFGFHFHAFPDPFNAPFTRTTDVIPSSGMDGSSLNIAATALVAPRQQLSVKYQRRRASDVGFPDFDQPYFFQQITLPWSNLDKFSANYALTNPTTWLSKLSATWYYQRQDRLLRNVFPVQFPVPSPQFFPINVYRLDIQSDTRQQVWTPGLDVQANFLTRPDNVLTAGLSMFRDRSEDARTTITQMSQIGQVALGQFGPQPVVFGSPVAVGPPTTAEPVRVPTARFLDVGFFAHDEWAATPIVRLTGGLRVDVYRVTTDATPGYDVASTVAGAVPPIDPATLPDTNGDRISRGAVTGEAGVVVWSDRRASLFGHYVHSYRHPNLEELLFSGPATTGNIAPNVTVQPETGQNVDAGARFRTGRVASSIAYFNNTYHDFISTEVVASSPAGSISQAINLASVRIQGVEAEGSAPFVLRRFDVAPSANIAWNFGTVLSGTTPLTGDSLAGQPQDNITPWKIGLNVRVSDRRLNWWAAYGLRTETDVTRVSPLLADSPFLIAQDLLGLNGFTVQRLAFGYDWRKGGDRIGVSLAIDNLADTFYREQFQFAPARGRSVTFALHIRGIQ
ncbi:MAG TPA: TonB-dependent receptor [Vicinamibacterales bacterium]|nr:TonB-dependent receptor [Vicinamibacterales bacterium]